MAIIKGCSVKAAMVDEDVIGLGSREISLGKVGTVEINEIIVSQATEFQPGQVASTEYASLPGVHISQPNSM